MMTRPTSWSRSSSSNYYHDRGKMKWGGFLLSEHTAALKRELAKDQNGESK